MLAGEVPSCLAHSWVVPLPGWGTGTNKGITPVIEEYYTLLIGSLPLSLLLPLPLLCNGVKWHCVLPCYVLLCSAAVFVKKRRLSTIWFMQSAVLCVKAHYAALFTQTLQTATTKNCSFARIPFRCAYSSGNTVIGR